MNKLIAIHKLSAQIGLTSRTLRHWESEGLYTSMRDDDSGWRVYDENAVLCIQITALLRKLDVPISDIKTVMEEKTFGKLREAILNRLSALQSQKMESSLKERQLTQFLSSLPEQSDLHITSASLPQALLTTATCSEATCETEDFSMTNSKDSGKSLRFIKLPPMRVAYHIAVSVSPEDEAMTPVINWIKEENLVGTARLLGGNVNPFPSGEGKPYGYGMCATIPDQVVVPSNLKEMKLPGGLYAMLESSDDIGGSWQTLGKLLSEDEKYEADRSRLCFEEHIRNDSPDGSGDEFFLQLLEPVKPKA